MEKIEIHAHSKNIDIIAKKLETSMEKGLTEEEAKNRIEKFGLNELIQKKRISPFQIFIKQFKDFLVYMLFAAIIISLIVGFYETSMGEETSAFLDVLVIFIILFVNAVLGFFQEYRAEKSFESLKKMAPHNAKVKRGGIVKEIDVKYVVPGDLLQLSEGDKIPADARLIKAFSLNVDESILTGESQPVHKDLNPVEEKTMLADRKNMIYSNTTITRGNGGGIVVATGMKTEIGKIAEKIQEQEQEPSPFQLEVDRFGKQLGKIIILICFLMFAIEFAIIIIANNGFNFGRKEIEQIINALTIAISLAVAAVPEGLIVVITIVLSIGMKKMAHKNALVKTLTAVETLGRVNIICSDKTGTLTKNEMTVVKVFLGGKEYDVEGAGYDIEGKIIDDSGKEVSITPDLKRFLEVCMFCNNSSVNLRDFKTNNPDVIGDPTEISLKVLAMKAKLDTKAEKINELPFNSERKMMSVVVRIDNKLYSLIKGAPDILLNKASNIVLDGQKRQLNEMANIITNKNEEFANNALRVLGLAYKPLKEDFTENDMENNYTYLGLAGIIDPARDEVKDSINVAKAAGIRTIMITGDHKTTAIAIAKQIGLTDKDVAITGADLETMSDKELTQKVNDVDIFARVTSEDKLRILNILKAEQNIVSMTGDGVNDAPAVKGANVGVAMGLKGTQVTQEAADMILIDDNYATIINAIEEGRNIFSITKNFFRYMLSVNFSEIIIVITAWILMKLFINIFLAQPLEPIQILWLNIVTDGIPAMALGFTPTDKDVMKFPPRKGFSMIADIKKIILITAIYVSITSVVLYIVCWTVLIPMWSDPNSPWYDPRFVEGAVIFGRNYSGEEYAIAVAQTIMLTNIVFFELFFVFSCTSDYKPMWDFPNKHLFWAVGISFSLHLLILFTPLSVAFHTVPMDRWYYWLIILLASIGIIPAEETRKYFKRRKLAIDRIDKYNLLNCDNNSM